MKKNFSFRNGFSLFEIVLVVAILAIISSIYVGSLITVDEKQALTGSEMTVRSILGETRSKTISSEYNAQYGVHFEEGTGTVDIFSGSVYDPNSSDIIHVILNKKVSIASVQLHNNENDVVFDRIFGSTDQYGTIVLQTNSDDISYATITIYATGVVE